MMIAGRRPAVAAWTLLIPPAAYFHAASVLLAGAGTLFGAGLISAGGLGAALSHSQRLSRSGMEAWRRRRRWGP